MPAFMTGTRNMGTELFTLLLPAIVFMLFAFIFWPMFILFCLGLLVCMLAFVYLERWYCRKHSWIRHKENDKWVYEKI